MCMKDLISIVIPSKNESDFISETLYYLNRQKYINGVKVIISDCSDDETRKVINDVHYENLDIIIIDGGPPSVARNNGAKLVNTPYILFLDSDMMLYNENTIFDCLFHMDDYDLVTCKVRTIGGHTYVFPIFEFFRDMTNKISPFAVGGFMFFNKSVFDRLGGFNEEFLFAEDYALSCKVNPARFKVMDHKVYTSNRRFKNKGVWYMLRLMILAFFNRNNPEFFKKSYGYWL